MRNIFFKTFILSFLLISPLLAGTYDALFELYAKKDFESLRLKLNEYSDGRSDSAELQFFRTLFIENGETANRQYEELFQNSGGPLKNLIAEKISDYYFALGFYMKASEYEDLARMNYPAVQNSQVATPIPQVTSGAIEPVSEPAYVIQIGAFSVEANAQELAGEVRREKVIVNVVKRMIGGRELFCVWIQGDNDYQVTEQIARKISGKMNISYRILKQ